MPLSPFVVVLHGLVSQECRAYLPGKHEVRVVLGGIADGLTRGVEGTVNSVSAALFEPVVRLGVTGLSRAGKTVFITSLVANLLNRQKMPGLRAVAEGRVGAVFLQPQPDDTVPRFEYERHLACLAGEEPIWPENTRGISELRLSFRVNGTGIFSGLAGPKTLHLDIVDYPGEWLLDLGLLDKSYSQWAAEIISKLPERKPAGLFAAELQKIDANAPFDEVTAKSLAATYSDYLLNARDAGLSDCTPGRFLLPGDLKGSPVVTFAPLLVEPEKAFPRGSLGREFERRFEAYKRQVVKPFFRDHFSKIDRQIVLMDVLGAIHSGPRAVEDMRRAMAEILGAFRPGRNAFLSQIFLGKRVEKILFAATKADHLHHKQHPALTAIAEAMLQDAKTRAEFSGAVTKAMSMASLRTTTEDMIEKDGRKLEVVKGKLLDTGQFAALYPGRLPDDPARLLAEAGEGGEKWLNADFNAMRFSPRSLQRSGEGLPHIRLDNAVEFLLGDRLR